MQEILFSGEGKLSELNNILKKYKNILLFTFPIESSTGLNELNKYFQKLENKYNITTISYVGKALPFEDIDEKYNELKGIKNIDLVIGMGGGTIIDLTKIFSLAYSNKTIRFEDILNNKNLKNKIDMLFIPTTAGTGSEATSFAVVYKDKIKYSVVRPSFLPKYVILDPMLLKSLPENILNSTILDALAQGIESIWAVGSTSQSREYGKIAIKNILDNFEKENSIDRFNKLQLGSYYSGKAINISKTTLSHSISYPLSSYFGIPHGVAVFLTLAKVSELNYFSTKENIQAETNLTNVKESFSIIFDLFNVSSIDLLVKELNRIMVKLGFSPKLKDYGIAKTDLKLIADFSITQGRANNNPRKLDKTDIYNLLEDIY
ncbi:phosphonoacetaldehyde reductase [candidate division KSB1 bacterium]|nr:phosphonoacetaldehyde reductase [candidate division KSB1 bacterium]MBL7094617.1 phosphonoacetaldehyde reductase [candidate division KSB1 bacterium]